MRKLLPAASALLATALLAAPALAEGPVQQRITQGGRTYTYTVRQAGDRQVIDGRDPAGKSFHLIVRGDSVTGQAGGYPVAFKAKSAIGAVGSVQVAAR